MLEFWKKSLRVQIAGSFSVLSLAIVALAGSLAFFQAKAALRQSVFDRLMGTAALEIADLKTWLTDRRNTLLSLSQLTAVQRPAQTIFTAEKSSSEYVAASARLTQFFSEFSQNRPSYREIFLMSKGGRVLVSSKPDNVGWYAPLNQYSHAAQGNMQAPLISNFYISPQTEQPTITFMTPLLNDQGVLLGILAVHLNLDQIDQILQLDDGFNNSIDTYFVGDMGGNFASKNVFLSAKRFGSDEFPDGIDSPGIATAMAGNDGHGLYLNYRGVPVLGVYRWLENKDIALLVEMDQKQAFAPARHLAGTIFLTGLGLAGISTTGILALSRQVVDPILKISRVATQVRTQVQQGNFSNLARTSVTVNNEVGTLADTFNQLAQQLGQSYKELQEKNHEIQSALNELEQAQLQLIQTEKMASLGQMVAGIAHEVNNPVNFIHGNLTYLDEYIESLFGLIRLYEVEYPITTPAIVKERENIELDFLVADVAKLIESMQTGTTRIRDIVHSMRNFSRLDESDRKLANLHEGIEGTLLVLQSRLKSQPHRSEVRIIKDYGKLPKIDCYPGQLNQVFLSLIGNALDALDAQPDRCKQQQPTIHIRSWLEQAEGQANIVISIADNGPGIPETVRHRIFDPFFTTKPVGQGTGLGLSISYSIVVKRHNGTLSCHSQPGEGTMFIITVPIQNASDMPA